MKIFYDYKLENKNLKNTSVQKIDLLDIVALIMVQIIFFWHL